LVAGWDLLQTRVPKLRGEGLRALGALLMSLAIFIKGLPVFFLAYFVLTKKFSRFVRVVFAMCVWVALSYAVMNTVATSWWTAWLHALGLYSQAATPEWVAFQSPPAMLYRFLVNTGAALPGAAFKIEKIFAALAMLFLFGMACLTRQEGRERQSQNSPESSDVALAILLSILFLAGPFSWANALLFTFPLVALYLKNGVSPWAWAATLLLALLPKDLWPNALWLKIAEWNGPALCLIVVHAIALKNLKSRCLKVES
jgi:hypothetical protein